MSLRHIVIGNFIKSIFLVGVEAGEWFRNKQDLLLILAFKIHNLPIYIAPLFILCGYITLLLNSIIPNNQNSILLLDHVPNKLGQQQ